MPSYVPPKKNTEYIFYVSLEAWAGHVMQVNPTIVAGDAKVSTDSGAVGNLTTLPSVDPAGSVFVKVTVSATEMNGDNTKVWLHDPDGEWCDLAITIPTSGQTFNEIDALIDILISRLTAARAGYLDELAAANLPTDIGELLIRLSAARAGYLDNLSAGAVALEATLTAIGGVVVAIDARLPADPADQSLVEAHVTAEVDDLITRVKGLDAIYDSVALRALEATLTAIKGAGWTNETLKAIKDAIDALSFGDATEAKQDAIEAKLDDGTTGLANLKALIDAIELKLDSPDNFKADVSALALEATLTAIKGAGWNAATDTLEKIRDALIAAQADLDNPDQYKADVTALALEATLTAIGGVVVAIDARLPADPADQSLVEAHVTAEVDDLITRVKGLNAIFDSLALRALETTLTAIKGAGWTNETLKLIKELIDELESGEKPPRKASFRM